MSLVSHVGTSGSGIAVSPAQGDTTTDGVIHAFVLASVRLFGEALTKTLATDADIRVVGVATRTDAIQLSQAALPQVVLVSVDPADRRPAIRAFEGVPDARVLLLGVAEIDGDVVPCVEAGAAGFIPPQAGEEELREMVRAAALGATVCSPKVAGILMRRVASASALLVRSERPRLSAREIEIARLLGEGLANKEIASRLSIELTTVKNHVHNILEKLGIARRADIRTSIFARRLRQDDAA